MKHQIPFSLILFILFLPLLCVQYIPAQEITIEPEQSAMMVAGSHSHREDYSVNGINLFYSWSGRDGIGISYAKVTQTKVEYRDLQRIKYDGKYDALGINYSTMYREDNHERAFFSVAGTIGYGFLDHERGGIHSVNLGASVFKKIRMNNTFRIYPEIFGLSNYQIIKHHNRSPYSGYMHSNVFSIGLAFNLNYASPITYIPVFIFTPAMIYSESQTYYAFHLGLIVF
ncbi:MAG: hypothetical protein GF313_11545 [Caldithrix sp.]|nr:hypothetical protein [Caldithrix sp.]